MPMERYGESVHLMDVHNIYIYILGFAFHLYIFPRWTPLSCQWRIKQIKDEGFVS